MKNDEAMIVFLAKCLELGRTPTENDYTKDEYFGREFSIDLRSLTDAGFDFEMGLKYIFRFVESSYVLEFNPLSHLRKLFKGWEWMYRDIFVDPTDLPAIEPNYIFIVDHGHVIARRRNKNMRICCVGAKIHSSGAPETDLESVLEVIPEGFLEVLNPMGFEYFGF